MQMRDLKTSNWALDLVVKTLFRLRILQRITILRIQERSRIRKQKTRIIIKLV
jgi:hypothetical protein